MVQRLILTPHSKKHLGLSLCTSWGLSVRTLYVLLLPFTCMPKYVRYLLILKLIVGLDVRMCDLRAINALRTYETGIRSTLLLKNVAELDVSKSLFAQCCGLIFFPHFPEMALHKLELSINSRIYYTIKDIIH